MLLFKAFNSLRSAWILFSVGICFCSAVYAQPTITQAEFFIDTDPGLGLATPITIAPGQSVNYSNVHIPTTGLSVNTPHWISTRFRSSEGGWSPVETRVFMIITGLSAPVNQLVTQIEYWWDADSPTLIDVPDGGSSSWAAILPTTGFTLGLHRLNVRYLSAEGIRGTESARYVWVMGTQTGTITALTVTQLQYWFDNNIPTVVNITDNANVSFASYIQTTGLDVGIHTFHFQYLGSEGFSTPVIDRRVLIITPPDPPQPISYLAGAEYFINVDPGPGHGIAIPLPADGAWDHELNEIVLDTLSGLPTGNFVFYLRFRDDMGHWGQAFGDTLSVAPILVINSVGSDIVLNWQADPGSAPFHIYRNTTVTGPFTDIAQTSSPSYTDIGVVDANPRMYYYVTFSRAALTDYQLPNMPRPRD